MNTITIGIFRHVRGAYQGRLQTLGIDTPLCLLAVDPREGEDAPDWRVHIGDSAEGSPTGEAWNRLGGPGGFHVAVSIDGPLCPRPIDAMLLTAGRGDVHHLVWSRPTERGEEG
ncbi:DUF736 domain-containing protein [Sphingopyxis sp. OPL5]|uniref:DUF736 domain-containing protein n=1 Tax=Sphingopyxis sp. OPL5 TaxID=2486273 RepID=UPI00164EC7FC|nr:DUF736 domain-containing protein [Sphingopyxis sp. OPL5]QNO27249.1 DUF736 domain-containing protein [Sphingopyxis sp. OPL5]